MIKLLTALMVLCSTQVLAGDYFGNKNGAANGVDVVAYFTDDEMTVGSEEFEFQWSGSTWRFSSAKHMQLFAADPEHYAPQFYGAGSLTVAHGAKYPGNPVAWSIYNDRLYFFLFPAARTTWLMNPDQLIPRAREQWPGLNNQN